MDGFKGNWARSMRLKTIVSSNRIKVYRILPKSRAVFGLRRSRAMLYVICEIKKIERGSDIKKTGRIFKVAGAAVVREISLLRPKKSLSLPLICLHMLFKFIYLKAGDFKLDRANQSWKVGLSRSEERRVG